jgi:hypothetical protein
MRYCWLDLVMLVFAAVLLIPLLMRLTEIVIEAIAPAI